MQATAYEERLDRLIQDANGTREREFARTAATMRESELIRLRFERVAEIAHSAIIRTRMDALSARFEHATVEHFQTPDGLHSYCRFERTTRFPATAELRCSVVVDPVRAAAMVEWSAHVAPCLSGLDIVERLAVPLDTIRWSEVVHWVEDHLLQFLRGYLAIQDDPRYQQENVYVDPVCGMEVPGGIGMESATHEGTTYVFCATACRERFETNPQLFLDGIVPLRHAAHQRR